MSTPALQLATLYETDVGGRLTTTREPAKQPAPMLVLVRSKTTSGWGIGAGVPDALAEELAALARDEPPARDLHDLPKHVDRYRHSAVRNNQTLSVREVVDAEARCGADTSVLRQRRHRGHLVHDRLFFR